MISYSGCVNTEADDLSSCERTPERIFDFLRTWDNVTYAYFAFVVYFILPFTYMAINLYQELTVMENEHRNGNF